MSDSDDTQTVSGEVVPAPKSALEQQQARTAATLLEDETIDKMRANAKRAGEIEADLLERAAAAHGRDVPGALKAVADSRAKSIDGLLKLSGRMPAEGPQQDLVAMANAMASKGYLKINVTLESGPAHADAA